LVANVPGSNIKQILFFSEEKEAAAFLMASGLTFERLLSASSTAIRKLLHGLFEFP